MKDVRTGLMFTPVPVEFLDSVWTKVSNIMERSVKTAEGKYKVEDLYPEIVDNQIVLWIVADHDRDDEIIAAITTRLIEYPQGNSMAMDWIGGKRMKDWLLMMMIVLSRLRATLQDHLSIHPACLQGLRNYSKLAIFEVC